MYVLAQIAEWSGWLGSAGGPSSSSTPLGIVVLLLPSLALGVSFLMLVACLHHLTSPDRAIWSQLALAFATCYAVLISLVYFVQLTFVGPRLARGETSGIEMFLFVPFDSFLYAVDILGYSFMSVATLLLAPALRGAGPARIARVALVANGCLLPFIALQMYIRPLIWIAALWGITFPAATIALALVCRRRMEDHSDNRHGRRLSMPSHPIHPLREKRHEEHVRHAEHASTI